MCLWDEWIFKRLWLCGKPCWWFSNYVWWNLSIKFNDKKPIYRIDYYISHSFLLVTILLLTTADICYYFRKNWLKQKDIYYYINTKKWIIMNWKKLILKITHASILITKSILILFLIFYWIKNHMEIFY